MNKIIIIFGLMLILIVGVAFYQFSKNQTAQVKANGKITIGNHIISAEVVKDPKAQQIGLTKYQSLKEDQGMLFVFDRRDSYGFWMRDMKFPIDILFIRGDTIVSFAENVKPVAKEVRPEVYKPDSPVDKVLEIKAGLIKQYHIKKGDKVTIEIS